MRGKKKIISGIAVLFMTGIVGMTLLAVPKGHALGGTPIGYHDSITIDTTQGWACDPDNYNEPLWIHFYKEGNQFLGAVLADQPREQAVGSQCGGSSNHGFAFTLPQSLRDGYSHTIYAYAINYGGGTNPLLGNSPKTFSFPNQIYYTQPSFNPLDIDSNVLADGEVKPPNKLLAILPKMGTSADDTPVSWNVGQYTGFTPSGNLSSYQRGPNNNIGTTAAQVQDKTVGMWINSQSQPFIGDILPVVAHHDWTVEDNIRPWPTAQSRLSYAFELQVPSASRSGTGEIYAGVALIFRNSLNGKQFWYYITAYDPRGSGSTALQERVAYDNCFTCTKMIIVNSSFKGDTNFGSKTANSAGYSAATWGGFRYFEYRINWTQFQAALNAVRATSGDQSWSTNPGDYQLMHFNYNPEVYAAPGSGAGSIGSSIRNITLASYMQQ